MTLLQTKLVPTLKLLHEGQARAGKVVAGGMPAGTREWHLIVELPHLNCHRGVNHFLQSLPVFEFFDWTATPLVTVAEYWEQFNAK